MSAENTPASKRTSIVDIALPPKPAASVMLLHYVHHRNPWSVNHLGVLEQPCCWIVRSATRLEIPHHARHRTVLGHGHQRGEGNALATAFGHEAGAQAVAAKIPLQTG